MNLFHSCFALFVVAVLAAPSFSSAATIDCSVLSQTWFGGGRLDSLQIIHEIGKTPVLKTPNNIDLQGKVVRDPKSGAYAYRFGNLYRSNAFCRIPVCRLGWSKWREFLVDSLGFENTCTDTREILDVRIDPKMLDLSIAIRHYQQRDRSSAFGIHESPLAVSWGPWYSSQGDKLHCEIR